MAYKLKPRWPSRLLDLRGSTTVPSFPAGSGVMILAEGARIHALKRIREKGIDFDVFAVVPNMTLYVRQVSQLGAPRAGLQLAQAAGLTALLRTGLFAVGEIPRVLRNDFLAVMRLLVTFELNQLLPLQPAAVFLHPQITDLGLSFCNRKLLTDFQERSGAISKATDVGFGTNNLTLFEERVTEWGLPLPAILTPFNPQGFLMKRSTALCQSFAAREEVTIVADRSHIAPGTYEETAQYIKRFPGIKTVVVDRWEAPRS